MSKIDNLTFHDGHTIPQLGFGVFQVPPEEAQSVVSTALQAGYRHLDTAAAYNNEEGVGRAIAESGLSQDDLFITTKLWNSSQGYDATLRAFDESMNKLGLDYLDLYLIHWPQPANDRYVDTWKAFGALQSEGRIRSIGVSNFQPDHLDRLRSETGQTPVINQIELHPHLQQEKARAYHDEHSILTEAWSPLAQGGDVLGEPEVARIAQNHGKNAGQVVIRWHLQLGNVVIPKSVTPERIRGNADVFDFELSDEEMRAIAGLNRDKRIGPNPDDFNS